MVAPKSPDSRGSAKERTHLPTFSVIVWVVAFACLGTFFLSLGYVETRLVTHMECRFCQGGDLCFVDLKIHKTFITMTALLSLSTNSTLTGSGDQSGLNMF